MSQEAEVEKTEDWSTVYRRVKEVVEREIAGETLLVPVRGRLAQLHRLFVLNPVGVFIWRHLDGEQNLGAIRRALVDAFEVDEDEAGEDLRHYVAALREAELVAPAEPSP